MPHTYKYRKHITILQSIINPITRYSSYTKISFCATSFPRRFHATPTTLKRCTPVVILPVFSTPLDLRFNSTELFKIIARAIMLPQHIAFSLNNRAYRLLLQRYFQKPLLTIHTVLFYNFIHRYSQSNGYTPKLRLTTRLFPVLSTSLVCRNCILQVIKRCLFFIWCFFKRDCFATPLFNTVGFAHIDYVRKRL